MGGGELVTLTLARELEARGHEVTVFTPPFDIPGDPDNRGPEELHEARAQESFDIETTRSRIYDIPGVPLLWKKMVLHPWLAFNQNTGQKFDHWFVTYSVYPVVEYWARRGVSLSQYFHGPIIADKCGPLQRYTIYPPLSFLYSLTNVTGGANYPAVANSKLTRDRFWNEHRVETGVVYPPVDTETLGTPVVVDEGIPDERYVLLSGRFVPFKKFELGLQRLEAALDQAIVDRVIVAGRLDNREYFDRLRREYPFATFRTDVPGDQWLALHQQADAYVFSNYEEDFGLAGAEAAAAGTAVVTPRGPGVSEVLSDWEHGYLVDEDMSGTVEAIEIITSNETDVAPSPQVREQCGINVFVEQMLALSEEN